MKNKYIVNGVQLNKYKDVYKVAMENPSAMLRVSEWDKHATAANYTITPARFYIDEHDVVKKINKMLYPYYIIDAAIIAMSGSLLLAALVMSFIIGTVFFVIAMKWVDGIYKKYAGPFQVVNGPNVPPAT